MESTLEQTQTVLLAQTARDMMTPNPISIGVHVSVREALTTLLDKGISGAPVINEAGRPIGVISRTDILRNDREKVAFAQPVPEYYDKSELLLKSGDRLEEGYQVEAVERSGVREVMTPLVYSVCAETSALETIQAMVAHRVHRMFVVDASGTLVGVVSALDVLGRMSLR